MVIVNEHKCFTKCEFLMIVSVFTSQVYISYLIIEHFFMIINQSGLSISCLLKTKCPKGVKQ